MNEQNYPGPARMVKIDGPKVKNLRESKGLTQLYIATIVEVTTDTISRWENKRYPTVKEENALKLAQALEVELEEILEKEETASPAEEIAETTSYTPVRKAGSRRTLLWLLVLVLILLLPFLWYNFQPTQPVTIFATRILPPHIPAGQPFPVIITVSSKQQGPFSLILKETLPEDCTPLVSSPPFTSYDPKTGTIKWISRTTGEVPTFVYLGQQQSQKAGPSESPPLRFNGSVTLRDKNSPETEIAGAQVLSVAGYHWADTNQDNRIEDEEILAAYDTFSALDNINYDWQKLDEIWSGAGYFWDADKQEYVIKK